MTSGLLGGRCEAAHIRLRAHDGYELAGVLYSIRAKEPPANVALIHPGAGIRAQSYRAFATFLAEAGIPVLLYDYRGIGQSRHGPLRNFPATVEDWAEYDCAAAIRWLRERFPDSNIVGIAHSIGSLLVGGAANAGEQGVLLLIGAHTAYYADYAARYRVPMTAFWHGLMPLLTKALGYFPARTFRLGEDVPPQVALQWAGRRTPELRPAVRGERQERRHRLLDRCASLQLPVVVISVSDDAFATAQGTARLLSYYPRLNPIQRVTFTPADAGTDHLGHFGIFRRMGGSTLWPRIVTLLGPYAKNRPG